MAEPVLPAGFKVIDDSVPEGFDVKPSVLEKGLNTLRGVVGIPRRTYEEVVLPFAENITSQTLGLIDAGTTGAVVGRNYLQDLLATGSFEKAYNLARTRDPGVPQFSKMFTPSSEFSKSAADISGKIWAAPAEFAGELIDLPLESVKAPEYVRSPVKAVGELASYPVAIGGAGAVKGLVRKYLPEAVKKVSNERLLRDRSKLEVKENIETSAEAREARIAAQEYNRQRTSAEMENFAEEKLGQLRPIEESPALIETGQPVSEFTPKESTNLQSQAVDIVGQLKNTLPTWEVDRLNELSQKPSIDWTPEDRLFFKEKQGQIKDLPVEEVAGRAAEPSVPEGFSLVDEFGRKIDSSSSMFREPERSKIDEVAEKGVEQSGKVQAETESKPKYERFPGESTLRSGVNPLDLPNVVKGLMKNARELWEEHKALAAKDRGGRPGIVGDTVQAFREFFKEPERVLNKEEAGKKIFKELATAEENVNAFIYRNFKEYEKATRGIKKGSKEAEQIGKALDGQISRDQLTQNEQKAYDFLKQNFESMIVEYARRAAGSEEAYRRVVQLVGSKIEKQTKVKDLSPELRAEYDDLYKQAKELRGDKKVSELTGDDKVKYEDLRQEMRDLLSRDFRKKLPEGEAEAYDILSRKIKDYLPHMFEKEDLIAMFTDDIARSKKILETATNKGLITRTKNRIAELEKAVTKMQGGGLVTFNQLPSEIFFRFFQPRKGKQGYSFDALQAYETYLFGIARKMFDEPALKKISQEHFKNLSPELKPYAQEFVDHYFGYDRYKGNKLASAITSLEWMRTLGLNPRSAIVNLTQRLNTLAWVGEKYAAKAEKMMLLERDKANAIFEESGIAREVPNVLTEGPMPKGMEALRSVVGFMFNKIELGNRKHAYLSGYLKGLDLGKTKNLTGDALETFAKKEAMKVVHKTQFRYGKLGMPKAMWNPVGRVALQFSSYPIKQLGFITDMWRKDPKTFLKWFAYAEGINYTMQELFDTDLSNALGIGISFGEALKVVDALSSGDTKAAYRHLRQTVKPGSGLLPSGPGPMVSGALKVATAAGEGRGGEQLVKELTPIMYTRGKQAVQAIEGEQNGEYPILDDKGHPMYRLSARQLAQRTLGPKTAKEGKEQKKWTEERLLEQERKQGLSSVVEAYLSGDKAAFRKAVLDNKEAIKAELKTPGSLQKLIENEVGRRKSTKQEREKPASTKSIYQYLRTGDVIQ